MSDPLDVVSGVQQGSILGPLPFIMFMNNMANEPKENDRDLYANDSIVEASCKTMNILDMKLN